MNSIGAKPADLAPPSGVRQIWFTAEEAAKYLRLPSAKALYQAVRRGQIPVRHLGKRLRFFRSELDAAMTTGHE